MNDESLVHSEKPAVSLVPPSGLRRTWGLGAITVFLLVFEGVTGLILTFYYPPTPQNAAGALVDLIELSLFAPLPELHGWGAHGLVIAVWLHLFRAFVAGSHRSERLNWTLGVVLLALCLGLTLTGLLLPWNQEAYGAVSSSLRLVGSLPHQAPEMPILGQGTLMRFYALHCFVLPLLTGAVAVCHVRRAWRDDRESAALPEADLS